MTSNHTVIEPLEEKHIPRAVVDARHEAFTLRRVHRYRLYPSRGQEAALERQLELCRRLYNKALWWRQGAYKRSGEFVTQKQQLKALTQLNRESPEYRAIRRGVLEDVIDRVDLAYRSFFRRVKRGDVPGFPRPKAPGRCRSMTYPRSREFKFDWDGQKRYARLSFKGFSGLKLRVHRPLPQGVTVKRLTVVREPSGHWYAVLGWDLKNYKPAAHPHAGDEVALHFGLKQYATTDAGEVFEPHGAFGRHQAKLAKRQRRLSRKKKGSRRRERQKRLVAKQSRKMSDHRRDFQHKLSRSLVEDYGGIYVNRYGLSRMLYDDTLRNLNRRLNDAAWYDLLRMIRYKAESAGAVYVEVDAEDTAQECSRCDNTVPKDLSVREHACPRCGLRLPRAVNAARNVKKRAVRALRGGIRPAGP